jgi:hypothetical protein
MCNQGGKGNTVETGMLPKKKLESLLNPFNQPHRRCQRIQLTYYFARRRPVYYNNTNGKCRVAQSPPNSLWFFIF